MFVSISSTKSRKSNGDVSLVGMATEYTWDMTNVRSLSSAVSRENRHKDPTGADSRAIAHHMRSSPFPSDSQNRKT